MSNVPEVKDTKSNMEVPEYLQLYAAEHDLETGLEEILESSRPPFVKIVQDQSTELRAKGFSVGDVLLTEDDFCIADIIKNETGQATKQSERVSFTPLSFYREWICRNPLNVKPFIRERSRDPNSVIARKAKSFDQSISNEFHPDHPGDPKKMMKFCETLNYISLLHGVEGYEDKVVIVSFSVGSYKNGKDFGTLLSMRRLPNGASAPYYMCNFELFSEYSTSTNGDVYYALQASNPSTGPGYPPKEDIARNHQMFKDLKVVNDAVKAADIAANGSAPQLIVEPQAVIAAPPVANPQQIQQQSQNTIEQANEVF